MSSTSTRTHTASRTGLPVPVRNRPPRFVVCARPHGLATGDLVRLHHSLAQSLDTEAGAVVQFISPEREAGTEHVVYDLAYISAAWLGKRVLFVNGTGMRLDPKGPVAPRRRPPVMADGFDLGDFERSITRVVGLELYQMTLPSMRGALDLAPAMRGIPDFLEKLRRTFDLIVIAAPAAADAPMGVLLSRFVDGNIIVLESGRTRAPEATELRESLSSSGGIVLGAVLTKYRSYAPRWLRRWL
jgi:hypothetical protein